MIQPLYQPPTYTNNFISHKYGISSALLGGVNLSLNTLNAFQMSKGTGSKAVPVLSLLTGASSIIYGAINFPKDEWLGGTNESQKTLSMVNIGLGTTTMILGTWNLITNKDKKEKLLTWNLYCYPAIENKMALGLSFTKKF